MSLTTDLTGYKASLSRLKDNKISALCYEAEAYTDNEADSPVSYDYSNKNNIPSETTSDTKLTDEQVNKGFRQTIPALPKMFINHFFGRVSYNLNKNVDFLYDFLDLLINSIGTSNGLAELDSYGRVKPSQISERLMAYKGAWSASNNTPYLVDGIGETGDVYLCNTEGTVNFGHGNIRFLVNDRVAYNGLVWQRLKAGNVRKVSSVEPSTQTGNVNLASQQDITKIVSGDKLNILFPQRLGEFWKRSNTTVTLSAQTSIYKMQLYLNVDSSGIHWSIDNSNWYTVEGTAGISFSCIAYGNGVWIATAGNEGIWKSKGGINWERAYRANNVSFDLVNYDSDNSRFLVSDSDSGIWYSDWACLATE